MSGGDAPADWERLEALFEAALALPPGKRSAFLDRECPDPESRAELRSLLARADPAERLFDALAVSLETLPSRLGPVERQGKSESAPEPAGTSAAPRTPDPLLGRSVGHYRIARRLGSGGMGVVYRARDVRLKREVALKFPPPYLGRDPAAKERLLIEARAAAALDHPNICTVHEIGETEDGRLFIAMACYEGETLRERIARGPLPAEEAVAIAAGMARGLAAAHARGVVHRDIKPGNVMLTADGGVKLLDFGLAKVADVRVTPPGFTPGTVAYMSPEQVRGEVIDARTDLWSLGVVLYEMLSGRRPFGDDADGAVLDAVLHRAPDALPELRPETPEPLSTIVGRLLAKDPSDRDPGAERLLADLEAASASPRPRASRSLSTRPRGRPSRRPVLSGRLAPLAGSLTALAALAAIAFWLTGRGGSSVPAVTRAAAGTPNVAAHELYVRGSDPALLRSESGPLAALEYFRQAIELDSTYAAAWAGLARMSMLVALRDAPDRPFSARQGFERAERAARKAVSLDGSLAEAHATLGIVRWTAYDFESAETELKRSIDLDSSRSLPRQWLAQLYLQTGRPAEALAEARRALDLDSLSASAHAEVAHALIASGRYDEALARLERIAAVQPPLLRAAGYAAQAYAMKGMWPQAIAALRPEARNGGSRRLALYGYMLARGGRRPEALDIREVVRDRWRDGTAGAFDVAIVHAGLGELDRAFDWLDRAIDDHSALIKNSSIMEPLFEDLRADPRFERVRERLGLPMR